ncbi:MAG: response regulator [Kiritimatiellia bacterium]
MQDQTAGNASILIADDDGTVRSLIVAICQRHGAAVSVAGDGRKVDNLLQAGKRYDVIVLDLLMPHASGWDLIERIRQSPANGDTPVIVMTGAHIAPPERERLLEKVSAIVDKGAFRIARFEELLQDILQSRPQPNG